SPWSNTSGKPIKGKPAAAVAWHPNYGSPSSLHGGISRRLSPTAKKTISLPILSMVKPRVRRLPAKTQNTMELLTTAQKNSVLSSMMGIIDGSRDAILAANQQDLDAFNREDRALYDRLVVDNAKV